MHAMTEVVDKDPGLLVVHRSNEGGRKAAALKGRKWAGGIGILSSWEGAQNWYSFLSSCWYVRGLELAW